MLGTAAADQHFQKRRGRVELGHQKDFVELHRLIQNYQKRGRVELGHQKDFVELHMLIQNYQKVVVEELRNHQKLQKDYQKVVVLMNDFFVDHAAAEEELESSSIH